MIKYKNIFIAVLLIFAGMGISRFMEYLHKPKAPLTNIEKAKLAGRNYAKQQRAIDSNRSTPEERIGMRIEHANRYFKDAVSGKCYGEYDESGGGSYAIEIPCEKLQ